jgi:hypothetical protein
MQYKKNSKARINYRTIVVSLFYLSLSQSMPEAKEKDGRKKRKQEKTEAAPALSSLK